MLHHDYTIKWPLPELVPPEWLTLARGRKQPFFLNHVRGSTRLKHAAPRPTDALPWRSRVDQQLQPLCARAVCAAVQQQLGARRGVAVVLTGAMLWQ